ncbi:MULTISPECIES: PAS domain S-box protein [Rhodomicrobium]|uniref:PAS domain S-box protein n=1 Tax=Rhodomicrobium TaxID=1068 RepID=UPI000B4A7D8F|nr:MULTISPECIES: PAS domain S-box protein [Rhodomicrobium]
MFSNNHIVQICPDGIITVSADGRIKRVNAAAEIMFGWAESDLLDQPIEILIPDDDRARHAQHVHEFSIDPDGFAHMARWRELRAQKRDGSHFPVNIWLAKDTVDGNRVITSFVRDMSDIVGREAEMAEAQRELSRARVNHEMLALVAQYASDIVIITDAAGITVWVNRATELVSGYRAVELIGRKPGSVLQGPNTDPKMIAKISRALLAGEAIHCEILNYTKSGSPYWIDMSITPVHDAIGRLEKYVAVERDITAAKQRAFELEAAKAVADQAEQRLAAAIVAMSEGFSIYDSQDRLVMANDAFRNFRADDSEFIPPGISFEQMCRNGLRNGYFDTEGLSDEEWIAKQMKSHRDKDGTDTLVKFADGRWMLRRDRRTAQGELISVRTDITAIKQHEQTLLEARERAEAGDRAKSEFVAMISHELRTPITGIIGFNQLMLGGELSPPQRERAEIVKESSEHLLQLVNNVLDLSKAVGEGIVLDPEPFRLGELISSTIDSLRPLAARKGLDLSSRSDIAPQTCLVGDAGSIKQILINLVGNAIKFTSAGFVILSVTEKEGGILFEVADSGAGIPEDKQSIIFDRFAQLGGPGDRAEGAGLGLSISKRLVDLMKGTITVTSKVRHGSVFSVWLPLPRGPESDGIVYTGRGRMPRDGDLQRTGGIFDVLVAEDLELNQRLIREILDSIGCRVFMAANGREALDRLEAGDFDLIIMDNQMPVMTGMEAIGVIRARTDWKMGIPIIALTANAMRGAEKLYKALGVNEYIAKPLNVQQVIAAVKRLGEIGRKLRENAHTEAA